MAIRELRDESGVLWTIYDVHPSTVRHGALQVREELASGWLCFQSDAAKRRLVGIPAQWEQLEDDALIKSDGLRLALWFKQNSKYMPDAMLMSLCNHRAFGKGQQKQIPEDDPSIIVESPYITAPFAWAVDQANWPTVEKYWGFKKFAPTAWSFSLSMGMRMSRKVGLHPALSRCANVGRQGGVHETPETFDASQVGLIFQESVYDGPYVVRARLDRQDLSLYDDWMLAELEAAR